MRRLTQGSAVALNSSSVPTDFCHVIGCPMSLSCPYGENFPSCVVLVGPCDLRLPMGLGVQRFPLLPVLCQPQHGCAASSQAIGYLHPGPELGINDKERRVG